jgi:SAM-dependent methyltransferase
MENHHAHCLICGSPEYGVLDKEFAHAYLVKCIACGFVFGSRIPSQQELQDHYALYPRDNSISPVTIKRYEELLDQFEPYRKTNRMLDVGCGDGHFLAVAKSKGWDVYGTEFTDDAVAVGSAKGIHMHKGTIQSWMDRGDFDVITSFEVLEHINDGVEHISKIKDLLRGGGLFYFTTPNFNALSRRVLGGRWKIIEYPEHLCYYTAGSMHRLLTQCGLKRLSVKTTGLAMQKFPVAANVPENRAVKEENLRVAIEENRFLQLVKSIVNRSVNALKIGDTLKGYYVKT